MNKNEQLYRDQFYSEVYQKLAKEKVPRIDRRVKKTKKQTNAIRLLVEEAKLLRKKDKGKTSILGPEHLLAMITYWTVLDNISLQREASNIEAESVSVPRRDNITIYDSAIRNLHVAHPEKYPQDAVDQYLRLAVAIISHEPNAY